jgi:hypothetical protein
MLQLRPTCENCNASLPPDSTEAMICSFECTFCRACVENLLENVCPNCGGGFCPRPIRPKTEWKDGNCIATYPATAAAKHRPLELIRHKDFASKIKVLSPHER